MTLFAEEACHCSATAQQTSRGARRPWARSRRAPPRPADTVPAVCATRWSSFVTVLRAGTTQQ